MSNDHQKSNQGKKSRRSKQLQAAKNKRSRKHQKGKSHAQSAQKNSPKYPKQPEAASAVVELADERQASVPESLEIPQQPKDYAEPVHSVGEKSPHQKKNSILLWGSVVVVALMIVLGFIQNLPS